MNYDAITWGDLVVWELVGIVAGAILMYWLGPPWRGRPWRLALTAAEYEQRLLEVRQEAFRDGCEHQAKLDASFHELVGRAVARMDAGQHGLGYQLLQTAVGRPEGPHWKGRKA